MTVRFSKKVYRPIICLLTALVLMLAAGCSLKGGQDMSGKLSEWQGQWFDVNGDTVMTIDGDRITFNFGSYQEMYSAILKTEGSTMTIANAEGEGFDIISSLNVNDDGSLTAEEMVLDAAGHSYRFVREEQLDSEREIVDVSKDMPKVIQSNEIESFSLNFSTTYGRSYGLEDKWSGASYGWEIEKVDDGTYQMHFSQGYDSYMGITFDGTVDAAYVEGLADKIRELGLPELNGYQVKNNVSLPGYGLYVTYESGETLMITAGGNGADTCVFDLAALMEYAFLVVEDN